MVVVLLVCVVAAVARYSPHTPSQGHGGLKGYQIVVPISRSSDQVASGVEGADEPPHSSTEVRELVPAPAPEQLLSASGGPSLGSTYPNREELEALRLAFETSPEQMEEWSLDFRGDFPENGLVDMQFLGRITADAYLIPKSMHGQMLQEAQAVLDRDYPYLAAYAGEVAKAIDQAKQDLWTNRQYQLRNTAAGELVWDGLGEPNQTKRMTYVSSARARNWVVHYAVYTDDHENLSRCLGEALKAQSALRRNLRSVIRSYKDTSK